jgi:hypothetical protein
MWVLHSRSDQLYVDRLVDRLRLAESTPRIDHAGTDYGTR